jgi:hypothetical protein
MKGVLLLCLMGVHVNKIIFQILFVLVLIFMNLFLHLIHEKNCKNANSSYKVPTFWE